MIVTTVPSAAVPGAVDALRASLAATGGGSLLVAGAGPAWPVGVADLDLRETVGAEVLARLRLAVDPDRLDLVLGPAALLAALRRTGEPVAFVRSTSVAVDDLAPLAAAGEHPSGLAVLSRSGDLPPADGRWPGPLDVAQLGPVDPGVLVATPAAVPVLEAWVTALATGVVDAPLAAAAVAARAGVLPASLAAAWWNLHERGAGSLDGAALVRLDGADPTRPALLHPGPPSPRHLLSADPALAAVVARWSAACLASRSEVHPDPVPGFAAPAWLRRRYRDAWLAASQAEDLLPPAPVDGDGLHRLVAWLEEPDPLGTAPLPRWQEWVWLERPDVRAAFGEVGAGDVARFAAWLRWGGFAEMAVPRILRLPGGELGPVPEPVPGSGVDVVGYFGAVLGNATSAERVLDALVAAGEPAAPVTTRRSASDRLGGSERPDRDPSTHDVAVAVVTPHQFASLRGDLGPAYTSSRYVVGYWFWETEVLAPSLVPAADLVDEIWVATEFGRLAFEDLGRPVHVLPHPITPPEVEGPATLDSFGLPERFTFLFAFDAFSNVTRKNPLAVVDAYTRAFGPGDGTQLVVKTLNGVRRAADLEPLRLAAAGRPDIHLLDGTWTPGRTAALMAAAGCYVSLHRSEGLGMTMAEALWLGTPVVATGYSGNVDFLDEESGFVVPYTLVPVPEGCDPYPAGTPWAEPDVAAAAALLRQVYEEPELAGTRTARGRERLASRYSPAVCGRRMRARIDEIRRTR